MSTKYNPGAAVTVGELELGDTVFLSQRSAGAGMPVPTHPATVTELLPFADGRVSVSVKNAGAGAGVPDRLLGYLPASREFRRAVAEA